MKWNDLKTNPPSGKEYAVILYPCRSQCGILYVATNSQYAIQSGVKAGYTHWAEIELAPTQAYWSEWQDNLTAEENLKSLKNVTFEDEELLTSRKEAAKKMAKAYEENADRWARKEQ